MRRVTIIATELRGFVPGGGMGTATTFLALALARMGHAVELLVARRTDESIDPAWSEEYARAGIRLRFVPTRGEPVEPIHFARPRSIELALRDAPPDVVVVQDFAAPAYVALRLRQAGLAYADTLFVVYCHGTRRWVLDMSRKLAVDDLRQVLEINTLERASLELADIVVSPSAYLLDWMRKQEWPLAADTRVIPYFTRSGATGAPLAARVGVDHGLRRLAFFGRLEEKKGVTAFVRALNALDAELLHGIDVEFIGKPTATWYPDRLEELFADATKRAVRSVSFTGELAHAEALARLSRPGTLAVMPSTGDNSPNTVYECLELGIPFIAGNAGGIPELVAPDDRDEVLCDPTPDGLAAALRPMLSGERRLRPPRAAFDGGASSRQWAELIDMRPRRAPARPEKPVDVVTDRRQLAQSKASHVVVLAEGTAPDPALVESLVRAEAWTAADAVTCGIRVDGTLHFFYGEPGGLGVLSNGYGSTGLYRRDLIERIETPWPVQGDLDWPVLAGVAALGGRIVSLPIPLATSGNRPGTIERDPSASLLVAQQLERATPDSAQQLARLAAGITADSGDRPVQRPSRRAAAAVLLLTLAAAAIRFATLGRQSYWYDELVTVSVLHRGFAEMLRAVPHTEATPYAYYVLAWAWTRVFGLGEAGLRSLSALAGTLTVPVAYAAGAALVSRRAGVITAALVAVNPFLIWYSQEARSYALFALFAALTLQFAARRSLVPWSLAAVAATATHYFALFVVAPEAVWLVRRRGLPGAAAASLPVGVLVAEVPLLREQRNNGGNISASPLLHRIAGIPKDLVVGYSFPAELAGTLAAAAFVALGLALVFSTAAQAGRRGAFTAAGIAAFTIAAPIALAIGGRDYVIARNTIAAAVPGAIFLASGYAARRSGVVAAAGLCALSLAVAIAVAADERYGRTDWRGAARALPYTAGARAIVATPTIDAALLHPYLTSLEPAPATARVGEIDVLALASQGGFSTRAVHPPDTPPRPAPRGFRLLATRRTPTYTLVRYRAPSPRTVTGDELRALDLATVPATILLQSPASGRHR